jgi:hypothetical protein
LPARRPGPASTRWTLDSSTRLIRLEEQGYPIYILYVCRLQLYACVGGVSDQVLLPSLCFSLEHVNHVIVMCSTFISSHNDIS